MALTTRVPSCFTGFQDSHVVGGGYPGVQREDALAAPSHPGRSRTPVQRPLSATKPLPEQDAFGLDYLRKQEEHGRDREGKSRKTGSSKKQDVIKACAFLTSFLLAPMVWDHWLLSANCCTKNAVRQSIPSPQLHSFAFKGMIQMTMHRQLA